MPSPQIGDHSPLIFQFPYKGTLQTVLLSHASASTVPTFMREKRTSACPLALRGVYFIIESSVVARFNRVSTATSSCLLALARSASTKSRTLSE
jgi:hypothetical protein